MKKRLVSQSTPRQLLRRYAVYAVMIVSVILLVVALLFVVLGYQLNRSDGRIEQGGLVQFDSRPNGAEVTIDGSVFGARTASKTTLNAGLHHFALNKQGYRSWQKSVELMPGAVLWLNYARLIPTDLKQEDVVQLPAVASSLASPNAQWIALKDDASSPTIRLADISHDQVTQKTITLPAGVYTAPDVGKGQAFSLETWDPGSRYILLKHTYNDAANEWIIADTHDLARTKNLTTLLGVPMAKVVFDGGDSTVLYAQTDHDVRKVDVDAATISRPLVSGVAEFSLYERSTLLYKTLPDANKAQSVGFYEDGADKPVIVQTTTDGQPLHFALGKYFNEAYVAIAHGETMTVSHGRLPRSPEETAKLTQDATVTISGGVRQLSMKNSGRFVVAQTDGGYAVYDNELKRSTNTTLAGEGTVTGLNWLDDYTVWSDRGGLLRLYEFDGANQQTIAAVMPGNAAVLSENDTYLYFVSGNQGVLHLSRVRLILP